MASSQNDDQVKVAKRFEHKMNEAVAAQTSVDESVDHDRSQDGTNQKSKSCTTQVRFHCALSNSRCSLIHEFY